jgi:hypothetical protein
MQFGLRACLCVVAIFAVAMAACIEGTRLRRLAQIYRRRAAFHAEMEQYYQDKLLPATKALQQAEERRAEWHRTKKKIEYQRPAGALDLPLVSRLEEDHASDVRFNEKRLRSVERNLQHHRERKVNYGTLSRCSWRRDKFGDEKWDQ